MVLCRPEQTLGGKTFWRTANEDNFFLVQEHKIGSFLWRGASYRLLIKCNNYLIAQAFTKEEIQADWESAKGSIAVLDLKNQPPANLSVQLTSLFRAQWDQVEAKSNKMGNSMDKRGKKVENDLKKSKSVEPSPPSPLDDAVDSAARERRSQSESASDSPLNRRGKKLSVEIEEEVEGEEEHASLLDPGALDWAKEQFEKLSQQLKQDQSEVDTDSDSIPLEIAPEDIDFGDFIGEGVYSEVYKGSVYGTPVAIKKFKNQGFERDVLKEVRKEVRIMKSIRHPNLLLFLGACTKPGQFIIVTELMDKSFHDLNSPKYDIITKLRMAREAAKGISWLHSLTPAIVHRDLKPENILIGGDGGNVVKVADFGLSLVKDQSMQEIEEMKKIRGSPAFMSPEALNGEELTTKADVYSFGVILWELLTGRSPYEDLEIESFEQLIDEICVKGTREKFPENTVPSLKQLIEACWQHDPKLRPNFLQILYQLDICMLDASISDRDGRKLWKNNFSQNNMLRTQVPWTEFVATVAKELHKDVNEKIFKGLKSILAKGADKVSMDEFGNILKWFGPLLPSEEGKNFLATMQSLFTQKWFHGDISQQEAETRLAGGNPGTFLIRFSSNPGSYALSRIFENDEHELVIVHIRIGHPTPFAKFSFIVEDQVYEYSSLEELVKAEQLKLGEPCSGSKYYATFRIKQMVSGYINTVVHS